MPMNDNALFLKKFRQDLMEKNFATLTSGKVISNDTVTNRPFLNFAGGYIHQKQKEDVIAQIVSDLRPPIFESRTCRKKVTETFDEVCILYAWEIFFFAFL